MVKNLWRSWRIRQRLVARLPFLLILVPYLIIVLQIYPDFGVAIDEPMEYGFGEMLYNRNFGRDPQLIRDFAVAGPDSREIWSHNHFHVMLLYVFNDTGSWEVYHLLNLLFFGFGLYLVYEIALQYVGNPKLALLAPVTLFFTPRFFGDAASNVKDPVFAIYYLLGLLAIIKTERLKHPLLRAALVGLACGPAAAMRTVGYSLLLVFGLNGLLNRQLLGRGKWSKVAVLFAESMIVLILMVAVHAVQVPFVASNPLTNLPKLMSIAQAFPWQGTMLYLSQQIQSTQLPWHYPLVWAGVITPVFGLLFGLIGLVWMIKQRIPRSIILAIILNVALYYLLKPVIYDGIRHLLFILVLLSLLAALVWIKLWQTQKKLGRWLLSLMLILHFGSVSYHYLKLHPYQYVYFNELVGNLRGGSKLFETDYWGTSYFEAARWFIQNKSDQSARVGLCGNEYAKAYFLDTPHEIVWFPACEGISKSQVDYVFAYQRNNEWQKVPGQTIFSVQRQGVPLMKILAI